MINVDNTEEKTTELVATRLAPLLVPSDLLIFSGDLGAGKTFFARALLYALGLDRDERVTSPTFALVHEYDVRLAVRHCDLYRLSEPEEVHELGLLEARQAGSVLVVEWGRPFVQELGGDAIFFDLEAHPRRLSVSGDCTRAQELIFDLRAALTELVSSKVGGHG